jgi:hypothetical protein
MLAWVFSNEIAPTHTMRLRVSVQEVDQEYFIFVNQWNVWNQLNLFLQAPRIHAVIYLLFRVNEQELTLVASALPFLSLYL